MAYVKHLDIFEILEEFEKEKSRKDKISYLQKHNNNMALKDVLRGVFDESIQWNLPAGKPPYTPNKPNSVPSSINKQHLRFKYFVKGLAISESLKSIKRESMFIGMLESVHPKDAEVLLSMKEKKSPAKGLTVKLVEEAFPGLIHS